MSNLTPIQTEILKAFNQMSEKTSFTEFILAKKVRENIKLDSKKKAGISLNDILTVTEELQNQNIFYSIHINSVNEILIKKENAPFEIPLEAKRRRQASEKSMSILTTGDLNSGGSKKTKIKKRNETKKININSNFEDLEE
ncbi:MAG: hypothetical protein KBT21_07785 [Treponema sp.]|nr:hypothetical protein [Candidatus Treponema merdequi]